MSNKHNQVVIVTVLWCLCLCTSVLGYNYTYDPTRMEHNFSLNYTELPFEILHNVSVLTAEGMNLNVTYETFLSGPENTGLIFDSNHTLGIEIMIPAYTTPDNYTSMIRIFNYSAQRMIWQNTTQNVTNQTNSSSNSSNNSSNQSVTNSTTQGVLVSENMTNYTANHTFNFKIYNDLPSINATFIQSDLNKYQLTICDFTQPYNTTYDLSIACTPNRTVQTTYDENIFNLTKEFTCNANGANLVRAFISLDNLTPGVYEKPVKFNIISEYDNVTFVFEIQDCIAPFPDLDYEKLQRCRNELINRTPEEEIECIKYEIYYKQKVLDSMMEAQEKTIINTTVIQYVNVTERVPVLELDDPELINNIKDIPVVWKQMITEQRNMKNENNDLRSDLQSKTNQIQSLQTDIIKIKNDTDRILTERLGVLYEDNQNKQEELASVKKWSISITTILLIGGLGGLIWLFYHSTEANIY